MRSRRRPLAIAFWLAILLVGGYLAVVSWQVLAGTSADEPEGGAIVVLGAAQYDGVPSPALASRLEHALQLWQADVAPLVVVTGGGQPGDRFNEATAGRTWLHARGVPEESILREVHSGNTYDQLAATARLLRVQGVDDAVLVSHPLHAARLRKTAAEVGLEATVSPTPLSSRTVRGQVEIAAREVGAVATGQVIGFRRLRNLLHDPLE